jgi:hypothetical protein
VVVQFFMPASPKLSMTIATTTSANTATPNPITKPADAGAAMADVGNTGDSMKPTYTIHHQFRCHVMGMCPWPLLKEMIISVDGCFHSTAQQVFTVQTKIL